MYKCDKKCIFLRVFWRVQWREWLFLRRDKRVFELSGDFDADSF